MSINLSDLVGNNIGAVKVATLPSWAASDEGRLIYALDEDKLYLGNASEWIPVFTNLIDSGNSIQDENGNEQIKFSTTTSAINEITITNAASGSGPQIQATGDDTNIDLIVLPKGTGVISVAGTTDYEDNVTTDDDIPNKKYIDPIAPQYQTIYIDAGAMVSTTTAGAATGTYEYVTNDINMDYFAFDAGATEEKVQFKLTMPENWDRSTIKAKFYWSNASGASASDTVEWGIKAGALSNDDAIDAALGTAQVITDTLLAAGDLHVTSATPAITVGGTPALGDLVVFEVYRNTDGTDDMVEDAWLFGVLVQFKVNQTVTVW